MECGECTACCTLSVVEELDKKAGVTCEHCVLTKGCSIYAKRPKVCKEFECAYLQGGRSINTRPDKCGIMFFKKSDRIIVGMLVPGVEVTFQGKKQIASFNMQGFSVAIRRIDSADVLLSLAPDHKEKDIQEEYLKSLKHGNI